MRILLSTVSEGQQSLERKEKLMRPNFKSHHEEAILNEIFYGQCYTFKARKMRRNNLKAKAKAS